jgi:hypothetical protein
MMEDSQFWEITGFRRAELNSARVNCARVNCARVWKIEFRESVKLCPHRAPSIMTGAA